MSDFDSMWDSAVATLIGAADTFVGNTILYKRAGETEFSAIKGYVLQETVGETVDEIDEIVASLPRVKIAKSKLPIVATSDRLQHPKIGPGIYRPLGAIPDRQGDYWTFDVQKVSL